MAASKAKKEEVKKEEKIQTHIMGIETRQIPNLLSLSRVVLLFIVTACFYFRFPFSNCLGFALFVIAALTDYWDGKTARKYKVISKFGITFDAICDKILVVGVFITFMAKGVYPQWFVFSILFVITREFIVSGLRIVTAAEGMVLAAEKLGKFKTAIQMVSICITGFVLSLQDIRDMYLSDWKYVKQLNTTMHGLKLASEFTFNIGAFMSAWSAFSYLSKYGGVLLGDAKQKTN